MSTPPTDPTRRRCADGGTPTPAVGAAQHAVSVTRRGPGRAGGGALIAGAVLVGLVVVAAALSLVWTPYDPTLVVPTDRLLGPTPDHWLGTDRLGRDLASQLLVGARTTLLVGLVAVGVAALVGVPLGVLAGRLAEGRGRWVAEIVLRGNDLLLAFPALLLAIMFAAAFGAGTVTAMVAVGIATVPSFARLARTATRQVGTHEYVLAARAAGRSGPAIALRHVLPNIAGLLVVQASVSFAIAVLAEAALSFLGLGTRPPTPSWGRMLQESQELLALHPRLALVPGVAVAVAVLGFNLLGDGLRDRLDPRSAG